MFLSLVQGLTVSKKYLIGKFAAKTHIAMVKNALFFAHSGSSGYFAECTQSLVKWLSKSWFFPEAGRGGFWLPSLPSLPFPWKFDGHDCLDYIFLYGPGVCIGFMCPSTAGCLELYFHQGDAGRECGRSKEDVDSVHFTSSCPQVYLPSGCVVVSGCSRSFSTGSHGSCRQFECNFTELHSSRNRPRLLLVPGPAHLAQVELANSA